jgi:Mrp family chromosome partitioning ATPase
MKIKLALLDLDKSYIQRFYDAINKYYSNRFEIHAFTNENSLLNFLKLNKMEILLIHESINLNIEHDSRLIIIKLVEKHTEEIELSNSLSESSLHNERNSLYKYQRISLIYKEILNVYSKVYKTSTYNEKNSSLDNLNSKTTVISFMSTGMGSGTSTIASSLALKLAEKDKKTLFLDLQSFATINTIFNAEGKFSMSEIIYAIKSNKENIAARLESAVKMDSSGVFFYDSCENPLEISELKADELIKLLNFFREAGYYEYIVIDINYLINELCLCLLKHSDKVFFVTQNRDEHRTRLDKIIKSIRIRAIHNNENYMDKVNIIYNKFINNILDMNHNEEFEAICYIPKYSDTDIKSIAKEIARTSILDALMA